MRERRSQRDGETRHEMGEQSHKDAMREAIRGDLERARSRNPSIFERPAAPAEPEPAPLAVVPEPEPELVTESAPVVPKPEPEAEPVSEAAAEPKPKRRFRLLFWR